MPGERDKPKQEETAGKGNPKGDKGKSDKGKAKRKTGDAIKDSFRLKSKSPSTQRSKPNCS